MNEIDEVSVRLTAQLLRLFLPNASEYAQEKFCKAVTEIVPFAWSHNRASESVTERDLRSGHPGARGREAPVEQRWKRAVDRTVGMVHRQHQHFSTFLPDVWLARKSEPESTPATDPATGV